MWFEQALEGNEKDADLLTHLALAQLRLNQPDRSLATFDRAAAADPKHSLSRYNKAVVLLFALKDSAAAEIALEDAARLLPEEDSRILMLRSALDTYR